MPPFQGESSWSDCLGSCYDPGSSLHNRNNLQEKDSLTSIFCNLTNGLAGMDAEYNVSRTGVRGSKG